MKQDKSVDLQVAQTSINIISEVVGRLSFNDLIYVYIYIFEY